MSWKTSLAVCFWVVLAVILLRQLNNRNTELNTEAAAAPQEEQHFFYHRPPSGPAQVPVDGPVLKQTSFTIQRDSPTPGMFTCHVIVKNIGNAKAVNIEVQVRPFWGTSTGGDDDGHSKSQVPTDSDPLWQISQWIGIPDLAPGESSPEESVQFAMVVGREPGNNDNPKIVFEKAKSTP